jgi:hypothetical protein
MTVQKVNLSNAAAQEGRATVYTDKFGNIQTVDPVQMNSAGIAAHSGILSDRLNDPRYYTGDAIT